MPKKLTVGIDHDTEMPDSGCDGWKLVSFGRRHKSFEHPDNYFPPSIGFRRKLAVGLAFVLDYFEHGEGHWSMTGEGTQCRWDTANRAGVLVWTGKPTDLPREMRGESARTFLEEYNAWANGYCYHYSLEDSRGNLIDSCGGYIGSKAGGLYMGQMIREHLRKGERLIIESEGGDPEGTARFLGLEDIEVLQPV